MVKDPIVEEVRATRRTIAAECGQDPRRYYAYLTALQKKFKTRLVSGKPRPLAKLAQVAEGKAIYGKKT